MDQLPQLVEDSSVMTTNAPTPTSESSSTPDGDSLLALLASKRQRQAMQRQRVFTLPGYDGLLGVKLRGADEQGVIADMTANLDGGEVAPEDAPELFKQRRLAIVRATVMIMTREDAAGEWQPLHERVGLKHPIRFDHALCTRLGISVSEDVTAQEILAAVVTQPISQMGLYIEFTHWAAQDQAQQDDELVGESSAAKG